MHVSNKKKLGKNKERVCAQVEFTKQFDFCLIH